MTFDIDEAVAGADVVMMLRMQKERQQAGLLPSIDEYVQFWQFNETKLVKAKPEVKFLIEKVSLEAFQKQAGRNSTCV